MAKFNWTLETNPNTGENVLVAPFTGKLLSISENPIQGSGEASFHPSTIEYENAQGKLVERSALVYEGNYAYGMSIGTSYLGKVIKGKDSEPLLVLSHLNRASRATDDDFDFDLSLLELESLASIPKK